MINLCANCGIGVDNDGDGNCAFCANRLRGVVQKLHPVNPWNILTHTTLWARHEFDEGRGDFNSLQDFSNRWLIMTAINRTAGLPLAAKTAFQYILKVEGYK